MKILICFVTRVCDGYHFVNRRQTAELALETIWIMFMCCQQV